MSLLDTPAGSAPRMATNWTAPNEGATLNELRARVADRFGDFTHARVVALDRLLDLEPANHDTLRTNLSLLPGVPLTPYDLERIAACEVK